ncbi:unnamed protein product [Tuber melanosporum]|uniref:(Perigord truffle) hypothetical protein n=1 Tax=Tuber melanosporum (strain Mel28) TaxID=656061 RepID=D5GN12_TUBMM|nr:uncharacterized protein GSTUM_00011011001 [Tuber melanosporum]CAZ85887.1 unnamed protein product [Tuber melanosporum]
MVTVEPTPSQPPSHSSAPSRGTARQRAGRVPFLGIGRSQQQQPPETPAPAEPRPQSHTGQPTIAGYRRRRYGKGRGGGSGSSFGSGYSSNRDIQELVNHENGVETDKRSQASGSTNEELHFDMASVAPSTCDGSGPIGTPSTIHGVDEPNGAPLSVHSSTAASSSSHNTVRKGKGKERAVSETNSTTDDGSVSHKTSSRKSNKPRGRRLSPHKPFGGHLSSTANSENSASTSSNTSIVGSPDENRPTPKLSRVPPQREFGGQLTTGEDSVLNGKLRAEATAYQPGESTDQYLPPHLRGVSHNIDSRDLYSDWGPPTTLYDSTTASVRSKSTVPTGGRGRGRGSRRGPQIPHIPLADGKPSPRIINMRPHTNEHKGPENISTRIHREITSGSYECLVCFSNLTRRAKVWNCKCCWAVFHLDCVKKWAKQGLEQTPAGPVGAEFSPTWRCPACNNHEKIVPTTYSCWCEKEVQPESTNFLPPHSCGQTCGKKRGLPKDCPHACDLQCHAGPCPPCPAMGPRQPCHCGRDEVQKRCIDTVYEGGWSCGHACGDSLPCGKHSCPKPCHPGVCGDCQIPEMLKCFCGNNTKGIKCSDKQEPVESTISDIHGVESWLGYWNCHSPCNRYFDCGKHTCQKPCHPQDALPARCPRSPDLVTHCPCGRTKISEILESPRASCEADVPSCGKACGKILRCGHECDKTCHEGECPVCVRIVDIRCVCGKTILETLCHQGEPGESPRCMRVCKTLLNCGRHECAERCCSGEWGAHDRLNSRRKMKSYNPGQSSSDGFESEHICTRPCGRPLKCGTHSCQMLCHRGPCGTCLEASFDELSCNCGRTVLPPPVACGATPPKCEFPCTRDTDCGHPKVPHSCHADEVKCPNCPYLVEKACLCGKKGIKNVPCFKNTVSCGTECGKKLSCGSHNCQKVCHASGGCDESCKQQCGKAKSCGHPCLEACHAPFQCPEVKPCSTTIQFTCACGGLKQEARCCSTKTNPTGNKRELKCNDQCRSRRMALAFELDPDRESIPPYSEGTLFHYAKDRKWSAAVEEKFRAFAESNQKRYTFNPMKSGQRAFLHSLAEDYGFQSVSQDPEPYRSVILFKGSNNGTAPKKTIAEYIASKPSAVPTSTPVSIQQLKKPQRQPYNAIILQNIRIGLLNAEIERELEPVLKDTQLRFNLQWSGGDDVLLVPKASSFGNDQIDVELADALIPQLKRLIAKNGLADKAELCLVGKDGQIVNRESQPKWSLVVGKSSPAAGTKPPAQANVGSKSRFDLEHGKAELARKSAESLKKKEKKKGKEVDVVDDWETAADNEAEAAGGGLASSVSMEANMGDEVEGQV